MSRLTAQPLEELPSNSSTKSCQKPLKISSNSAQVKTDTATREAFSTESFPSSCSKEETSPITTALEASPSTELSSQMRTSKKNIPNQDFFPWPMPVQTPTDHNSSSPLSHAHGLTANTSSSEKLLKE